MMIASTIQSSVAFSLSTLVSSVLNMKQFFNRNKCIQRQELSNIEEVQSSFQLLLWRKVDSFLFQQSVTSTTNQIHQHQRDRYINYHNRLEKSQLYSLFISPNGIECYETNCQPSVFIASYQCQTILHNKNIDAIEESSLMSDQDIKQTTSYISLTNLSNIIDHEPNVSRNESNSQSTSNMLLPKPSLFLADILNKMTHEQLAKSIAQLTKLHATRSKSNITLNKLQRTTSLPDLSKKPTKLHSVTSLLLEQTPEKIIQIENKIPLIDSTKQKHIAEDMLSIPIDLETSRDQYRSDMNKKTRSAVIDDKFQTPVHISEPLDQHIISNPTKLRSLPKRKLSQENLQTIHINDPPGTTSAMSSPIVHPLITKPSPILIESSKSELDNDVEKEKLNRNEHLLDVELDEQQSKSKSKSNNILKIDQNNTKISNLSNQIDVKTCSSSFNSMTNSISIKNQPFEKDINLENNMNQSLKNFSSCNKITNHPSQKNLLLSSIPIKEKLISSSRYFQTSNNKNENEHNLNNVMDHLAQQDIIISNTNTDQSHNISSTKSNKTKRILPFMKKK
ncbi:unnamed protein product [Rotaria sp. Silwood1]|nr:unnamed protein product [Rotaria sp. Silwood1]CAF3589368.1 unnamed protein product [Rotaria sp. Silwood1]